MDKVVFRQEFPCTIPNVATDKWLMSSFPSFEASAAPPFNRTMHFDGTFAHQVEMTDSLADCEIDVQGGVPLALYQASHAGKVGANLIFSQLTKMKTGEMACGRCTRCTRCIRCHEIPELKIADLFLNMDGELDFTNDPLRHMVTTAS